MVSFLLCWLMSVYVFVCKRKSHFGPLWCMDQNAWCPDAKCILLQILWCQKLAAVCFLQTWPSNCSEQHISLLGCSTTTIQSDQGPRKIRYVSMGCIQLFDGTKQVSLHLKKKNAWNETTASLRSMSWWEVLVYPSDSDSFIYIVLYWHSTHLTTLHTWFTPKELQSERETHVFNCINMSPQTLHGSEMFIRFWHWCSVLNGSKRLRFFLGFGCSLRT